ncbi:MAG: hypothetical protein LQ338_006252 [Usnochroma carphineum]|nr:MAG: hypothetical protein LQ338_006252 [Usnochroma carphineum]
MSTSPQIASEGYVRHYQDALDHQRRAFDSERAMWNIERTGLVEEIASLEASLRKFQASPRGQQSASTKIPILSSGSPRLGSFPGAYGPRHAHEDPGNQPWRGSGGKGGAQPTRNFSESATNMQTNFGRLSSIAENVPPAKFGKSFPESVKQPSRGVGGPDIQKHYDGITFRSTATTSTQPIGYKSRVTGSLSSLPESPGTLQLPIVHEVGTATDDNLTKDAGHTPLARTVPVLDGTTSAVESDLPTPASEQERPPLEPRASVAKIPSERSDSYFPPPADDFDQDPELQGQLGLNNDRSNDNQFLSELNTKLARAAECPAPPTAAQVPANLTEASRDNVEGFDQPEPEPKLRIKRSMNFGSQLGGRFKLEP